jgi:predicted nucleic acid-binding protein
MSDTVRLKKGLTLYNYACLHIELNSTIIERAKELIRFNVTAYDALHLASAEYAHADALLTTDRRFITRAGRDSPKIRIENPLIWLLEVMNEQ